MELPKPNAEHAWLQRLVGEWTYSGEMSMGPEQHKSSGSHTIRALGEFWITGEMSGEMPVSDKTSISIITLGYDQRKGKYVGTFVSDMMDSMWIYDGSRQADVLTLDTEGPSFKGDGALADYQDIIEINGNDEYVLWSQTKGDDGSWTKFMSMTFKRVN